MRSDTKQRLDKALRLQKLKYVAMACGVAAVLAAGLWFTSLDATVTNKQVAGTITELAPPAGMSTVVVETALMATLKLDDGRRAQVLVNKASHAEVGQKVEIAEHVHGSGRSTFSWK